MAKLSGATVIAIDIQEAKLKVAKSLGAYYTVNSKEKDLPTEVKSLVGSRGVDIFYEFVGRTKTMNDALSILARGAKLVFIGYSEDNLTLVPRRLVRGEFQIVGSRASSKHETIEVVKLVRDGKFKLDPLISHRLPLDRINDGLDLVRRGEAIRAVVMP
jgi:threonine dehydrogenase-like Zn-dependent dehydrogenase